MMNTIFCYVPGMGHTYTEKNVFIVYLQLEFNWEVCILYGNPNLEVKDTDFQALRQEGSRSSQPH